MAAMKLSFLLIAFRLLVVCLAHDPLQHCYDENGDSKYCVPARSERNIVAARVPTATSTCGQEKMDRVCLRAGAVGDYEGSCKPCSGSEFSPGFITDAEEPDNVTYWQSQTYSVIQYPNSVSVTFALGKAYVVEDIKIVFQSSRPESFTLLASTDYGGTFTPIHYYSRSCVDTYGVSEGAGESEGPGCSSDGAQLLPLSGGIVSFSATVGSAVIATDIRIRLDRHNTLGDEHTSEQSVLDSYYYAISDVAITGACFCNGHASSCSEDDSGQWKCNCAHNTAGRDCDTCLPLFNDLRWRPSTQEESTECKQCNCNGRAIQCMFEEDVFQQSGSVSGGVCDCLFNTSGKNCEVCIDGQQPPCSSCGCSSSQSNNFMCDEVSGLCICRPGFFGPDCEPCNCVANRTINNGDCDSDGKCECIDGVKGSSCDECLSTHALLSKDCSICTPGFHRVKDGCPACPECYDDVLLEYHSALSLLEELGQAINTSLNGSLVDDSLVVVVEELRQHLNSLEANVSDLFNREMTLKTEIQNAAFDAGEIEKAINAFRVEVVGYENSSSLAAQQIMHSHTSTSQIREVVDKIDVNLMQYARGNLTTAEELVSQINNQLSVLIGIATLSDQDSLAQQKLVAELVQRSMDALNASISAHLEMCAVLEIENRTLADLNSLLKNNITYLDQLHNDTRDELSQAVTMANSSLSDSVRIRDVIDNLTIPDYDPSALITESSGIHTASSLVIDESMSILKNIEIYRQNFTALNMTAHMLLKLAVTLNDTALDLTMRAHAAWVKGNSSVFKAEEVINKTESLLLQLNKLLQELQEFVVLLTNLKEMVEKAENVSSKAETEANRQKELLQKAFQTAHSTMEILLNAAINIQFAAGNATAALEAADTGVANTQTLKNSVEGLSMDASEASQSADLLKERAGRDSDAIAMAKVVTDYAEMNVTDTKTRVMDVESRIKMISEELNSLELIPKEKFDEFMMQLSSIGDTLDTTDAVLDGAQDDLNNLEKQFADLQQRYTILLQHRDLLRNIWDNIKDLDCANEF